MPIRCTQKQYGAVAVTFHWLSAILILVLLGSGFRAASMTLEPAKVSALSVHVVLGVTVLVLTLLRVAWWWVADRKPDAPEGSRRWQLIGARGVHIAFYVVIFGMAASGIGMMALSGAGEVLFAGGPAGLPEFGDYRPRVPHGIGARLMVVLLVVHSAAALYHHLIRKDGLLWRIWFARRAA